jgi:outer membrane protein assembly factor BamB
MNQRFFPVIPTCVLFALLIVIPVQAESNWPSFRGADAIGTSDNNALPSTWSKTDNIEWCQDLPGRGWSSPIVWGDQVIVTTAVSDKEVEAAKAGLYFGGERPTPDSIHQYQVISLDLKTGEQQWSKTVHEGKPALSVHVKNTYASETPVTDGERIYAYFGNLGIYCLDMEGNLVWDRSVDPTMTLNGWGPAASPTLHDGRLYVINDNLAQSYLTALDAKTGEEIWRTDRNEGTNWSTPYIWEYDERTEIITPGTGEARSYDLDGNLLWSLKGMSVLTIAVPYEYKGLLYVTSGWIGDQNWRPIYAIRQGAEGDISLKDGENSNEHIAWCQRLAAPYNPSTVTYEDRLYVLYDRGFVSCFNAITGEMIYDRERIRRGRGFTSSPWAYDGKIFCLNEHGDTFVIKAGDEFEILETNKLDKDDMGMASPALVGDRLIVRTEPRIYSIRNAEAGS